MNNTNPLTQSDLARFNRLMENNYDGLNTTIQVLWNLISDVPEAANAMREWIQDSEDGVQGEYDRFDAELQGQLRKAGYVFEETRPHAGGFVKLYLKDELLCTQPGKKDAFDWAYTHFLQNLPPEEKS